jgi:hypothetical protein
MRIEGRPIKGYFRKSPIGLTRIAPMDDSELGGVAPTGGSEERTQRPLSPETTKTTNVENDKYRILKKSTKVKVFPLYRIGDDVTVRCESDDGKMPT